MKKGYFTFDASRCVGCQACMVACRLTNTGHSELFWRQVWTYNDFQHPALPVFNLSLACNHCAQAPCLPGCPARAYSVDSESGTVQHDPGKCIGCQYCTWLCPYAAPKYNKEKGVIEKCSFCISRTKEGMLPVCTQSCPTGALGYQTGETNQHLFPGFPETGTSPAILITRKNERSSALKASTLSPEESDLFYRMAAGKRPASHWVHDLPLVVFTLSATILSSLTTAILAGANRISPWLFLCCGLLGVLFSSLHLGKKGRAWRSVLNLKSSWLSREILAYGLFLMAGFIWLLFPSMLMTGLVTNISGVACLVSIDQVYRKIPRPIPVKWHSAEVLVFTWPLFVAVFIDFQIAAAIILLIKGIVYLHRHWTNPSGRTWLSVMKATFRLCVGIIVPCILIWSTSWDISKSWILVLVAAGEMADRIEFYAEIKVLSPEEIYHSMLISHQGDR
jgi:Fe-S-cluster-containing dehydrogenase component/DMSO reductase anchor subunit